MHWPTLNNAWEVLVPKQVDAAESGPVFLLYAPDYGVLR